LGVQAERRAAADNAARVKYGRRELGIGMGASLRRGGGVRSARE